MLLLNYFFKHLDARLDKFWEAFYFIESKLPKDNNLVNEVNKMRNSWRITCNLYINYTQKTQSSNGWIKSFILSTNEHFLRKKLSTTLCKTTILLEHVNFITKIIFNRFADKVLISNMNTIFHLDKSSEIKLHENQKFNQQANSNITWANFFKFKSKYKPRLDESYVCINQRNNRAYFLEKKLCK